MKICSRQAPNLNFKSAKGSLGVMDATIKKGVKIFPVLEKYPKMEKFEGLYVTENDLAMQAILGYNLENHLEHLNSAAVNLTFKIVNNRTLSELQNLVESFSLIR